MMKRYTKKCMLSILESQDRTFNNLCICPTIRHLYVDVLLIFYAVFTKAHETQPFTVYSCFLLVSLLRISCIIAQMMYLEYVTFHSFRQIRLKDSTWQSKKCRKGVSPGTVSNVLNNPGSVSDEYRDRVFAAIQTVNYRINRALDLLHEYGHRRIGFINGLRESNIPISMCRLLLAAAAIGGIIGGCS